MYAKKPWKSEKSKEKTWTVTLPFVRDIMAQWSGILRRIVGLITDGCSAEHDRSDCPDPLGND